eukprot:GHVU01109010.1.p2 GENE.GHVU01109010.1~~GHVU01109010.1.p2  ORF type:complete len:251 (+),score=32.43 GHVU01109010.1:1259-2011(+)
MTSGDWSRVEKFLEILAPFRHATKLFSADRFPTASLILPVIAQLTIKMQQWESKSPFARPEYRTFYDGVMAKLVPYGRAVCTKWAKVAALLDPRTKGLVDKCDVDRDTQKMLLREAFEELFPGAQASRGQEEEPSDPQNDFFADLRSSGPDTQPKIEEEIDRWLAASNIDIAEKGVQSLNWLRLNQSHFPRLARMAADFLAIPAASVACEREFSTAGTTITRGRTRLQDSTVQASLELRAWLRMADEGLL